MRPPLAALVLLALTSACAEPWIEDLPEPSRFVLQDPEVFEILALDPGGFGMVEDGFHGYEVLGRAPLEDPGDRARLVALLEQGVNESDGMVAACFNPRHGIRTEREGERVDVVICFECLQIVVHGPGDLETDLLTDDGVAGAVSRIYRGRGLRIHGD